MRKKDIGLKQKSSVTCIGMKKKTRLCLLYKKKEAAQHNYSILGKLGGITVRHRRVTFWKGVHASRDRRRREAHGSWNTTAVLIKKSKAGNDGLRSVYFFYYVVCSFDHFS